MSAILYYLQKRQPFSTGRNDFRAVKWVLETCVFYRNVTTLRSGISYRADRPG